MAGGKEKTEPSSKDGGGKETPPIDFTDAVGGQKPTSVRPYTALTYPTLDVMAARTAYFGVTGQLIPDMTIVKNEMIRSGAAGQAAVERMAVLESQGWKFGNMAPNDAYAKSLYPGAKGWLLRTFALAGYHEQTGHAIKINPVPNVLNAAFGITHDPVQQAASVYTHELAHGQNARSYAIHEGPQAAKLFPIQLQTPGAVGEAARLHPELMLREEINALSSQVASMYKDGLRTTLFPHHNGLTTVAVARQFKNDAIGTYVQRNFPYEGIKPQYLATEQARTIGMAYDAELNKGGLFNQGRLNPAALESNAQQIRALTASDLATAAEQSGAMRTTLNAEHATSGFLGNMEHPRMLSRTLQALGSVGTAFMVTDLGGAFKNSPGAGLGRLTDIGTNIVGFEAGMSAGTYLGEAASFLLRKRMPGLATTLIPLTGILGGIGGSQVAHETVGRPLSSYVQRYVDKKLSR